jgi:type I restriction enzyme R subunit
VNRAIQKISENRSFTEEQQKWISLIREHLVKNLTIEEADFDGMPIFEQFGGMGKARRVFGDKLPSLIEELNLSIAA